MDGLLATWIGAFVPMVGGDEHVLQSAGYDEMPRTCGNQPEWERDWIGGFSSADFGDVVILVVVVDGSVDSVMVGAAIDDFDELDMCQVRRGDAVFISINELGERVTTQRCDEGGFFFARSDSRLGGSCSAFRLLRFLRFPFRHRF